MKLFIPLVALLLSTNSLSTDLREEKELTMNCIVDDNGIKSPMAMGTIIIQRANPNGGWEDQKLLDLSNATNGTIKHKLDVDDLSKYRILFVPSNLDTDSYNGGESRFDLKTNSATIILEKQRTLSPDIVFVPTAFVAPGFSPYGNAIPQTYTSPITSMPGTTYTTPVPTTHSTPIVSTPPTTVVTPAMSMATGPVSQFFPSTHLMTYPVYPSYQESCYQDGSGQVVCLNFNLGQFGSVVYQSPSMGVSNPYLPPYPTYPSTFLQTAPWTSVASGGSYTASCCGTGFNQPTFVSPFTGPVASGTIVHGTPVQGEVVETPNAVVAPADGPTALAEPPAPAPESKN